MEFREAEPIGVSVVIPTVGSRYLEETLDSVRHQTRPVHEIVVVFDGSPETSAFRDLRSRVGDDVKLMSTGRPSNGNVARNTGIAAATSQLVALVDDDDIWMTEKIERQLEAAEGVSRSMWLSATCVETFGDAPGRVYPGLEPPSRSSEITSYLLRCQRVLAPPNYLVGSTWLAPRELFAAFPFKEESGTHQDLDWLLVTSAFHEFDLIYLPEILVHYRTRVGSTSRTRRYRDSMEWVSDQRLPLAARDRGDFLVTAVLERAAVDERPLPAMLDVLRKVRANRPGAVAIARGVLLVSRVLLRKTEARVKRDVRPKSEREVTQSS